MVSITSIGTKLASSCRSGPTCDVVNFTCHGYIHLLSITVWHSWEAYILSCTADDTQLG
jgi:hypothetical protein